jgi:uncharacterized protein
VPLHAQHTPARAPDRREVAERDEVPPPATRDAVLLFVRAPVAGRVKTRLAAEIGAEAALRVYTRLAEHTLAEALRLGGVQVRVHFTPADSGDAVRRWLGPGPAYLPQPEGDLGERMRHAFQAAFHEGFRRVVIIGSDLPRMSAELLRRAIQLLDHRPVVLGPATDGGYYLLGLREMQDLFADIPWSTERVLDCTLQRLRAAALEPALIEPLRDVDLAADLPPELQGRGKREEGRVT